MAALFTLVALIATAADPPEGWETISPEKAGFTVQMPVNSYQSRQKVESDDGPAEVVIFQSGLNKVAYMVTYVDVAASSAGTPTALLEGTRDVVIASSKGRLISDKRITLKKNPGREFRASVPIGDDKKAGIMKARVYLVGRRVYQVMAIAPKDEAGSKAIDGFFASFKIVPAK
jgi:hypothetical protein